MATSLFMSAITVFIDIMFQNGVLLLGCGPDRVGHGI